MGLLTSGYSADSDSRDPPASRRMEDNTLYIAIKSLMSQAQVLCTPSIRLVQAGVLLAVFEYAHGHPQQAFMTIGTCARMAYAARLRSIPSLTSTASTTDWVAEEEEVNVWWGICVCERTFLCELPIVHQPLGSMVPTGEERLPLESSILDQGNPAAALKSSPVHALVTPQVGGFARAAQAAWLLDGVLHALSLTDPDQQQAHLADCDRKLQSLLAIVMQQNEGKYGEFCPAIALILRSLFLLHGHLLDQQPQYAPGASISTNSSLAALDTVTKMVIDICTTHEHVPISQIDHLPPSCLYIIRAALKHISEYHSATPDPRLHSSLKQFEARWGTSS
ncbi:hypothetical protein BDW74DRAFT_157505, partial [Aspergillus multicolor]|uniref:fungal specific transcription factor domain-containing protein n=1 Tax=Aspergillus multicolor TaxID=41759 RepID=UPI003CCC9B35